MNNQEFKNRVSKLFPDLEICSEYYNSTHKVVVKDKYGYLSVFPHNLLNNHRPTSAAAIDKNEYINAMLKEKFEDISLAEKFTIWDNPVLLNTKYGKVKIWIKTVLKGIRPTITTAINKEEFMEATLREDGIEVKMITPYKGYDKESVFMRLDNNRQFVSTPKHIKQNYEENNSIQSRITNNDKLKTNYIMNLEAFKNEVSEKRVLVVGDLHAPFIKEGYLEFCSDIYNKYDCNEVVFIGDLIDNHYSSYHEADPDGHSAGRELNLAIKQIKTWYDIFPNAKVCNGNHDLIPNRKSMTAGLSNKWIRSISEVLGVPNWEFSERFVIDDVQYVHGTGRKCNMRAKNDLMSTVQGHYHSESYLQYFVGTNYKIFALQIGCGVDTSSYAMAYGKHFNKQAIGCGVVINGVPYVEMMNL